MKITDKVTIPPQVMVRVVGDETVLLDLSNGTYFGLDVVGARIWRLMSEGKPLNEVCDTLMQEYDVAREILENDIIRLATELSAKGLIGVTRQTILEG